MNQSRQPQQPGQIAKHPADSLTIWVVAILAPLITYFLEDTGRLAELLGEDAASKVAIGMGALAAILRAVTTQPMSLGAQSKIARLFARQSRW